MAQSRCLSPKRVATSPHSATPADSPTAVPETVRNPGLQCAVPHRSQWPTLRSLRHSQAALAPALESPSAEIKASAHPRAQGFVRLAIEAILLRLPMLHSGRPALPSIGGWSRSGQRHKCTARAARPPPSQRVLPRARQRFFGGRPNLCRRSKSAGSRQQRSPVVRSFQVLKQFLNFREVRQSQIEGLYLEWLFGGLLGTGQPQP